MKMYLRKAVLAAGLLLTAGLAGCVSSGSAEDPISRPATLVPETKTGIVLDKLPKPSRKLDVAVYSFPDLTGQNKPGENFAEFSRAVTQGGSAILIDVLTKAGGGKWFDVVERNELQALLQERQIIQNTRVAALGDQAPGLPPLRFAGIALQGGIVGYDSNESTGGVGARYLGIGGDTQYRHDIVTVALRAVSIQTGRVIASVTTTKTLYSVAVRGGAFHFVAVDKLLEIESGFTRNHPPTLAVREAIQLAVHALILEGVKNGSWSFADKKAGDAFVKSLEIEGKAVIPAVDLQPIAAAKPVSDRS
jgi:curli production assembly/transport component CsgG